VVALSDARSYRLIVPSSSSQQRTFSGPPHSPAPLGNCRKSSLGFCRKFCRAGVSYVMMGPGLAGWKMAMDFKGSHFERGIVLWGVRWCVAYPISYRQLEAMMRERGVEVDHSTPRARREINESGRWQKRRNRITVWFGATRSGVAFWQCG
jgi:hypothetical protein